MTTKPRCARCQREYEASRPSRRSRGRYDAKHVRLTKLAIRRQPWCSRCKTPGTPSNPLTGDHRLALENGGKNTMSNYDVLCRACNSAKRDRLSSAG